MEEIFLVNFVSVEVMYFGKTTTLISFYDFLFPFHTQSEKSAQVYNLIGNFWRIKGDTQKSIECFRKALSILPEEPDFLLNLARVLFNLQVSFSP